MTKRSRESTSRESTMSEPNKKPKNETKKYDPLSAVLRKPGKRFSFEPNDSVYAHINDRNVNIGDILIQESYNQKGYGIYVVTNGKHGRELEQIGGCMWGIEGGKKSRRRKSNKNRKSRKSHK